MQISFMTFSQHSAFGKGLVERLETKDRFSLPRRTESILILFWAALQTEAEQCSFGL